EQRLAATGVNITSNNGALVITGNVQVDDLAAARPGNQANTTPDLTGVAINGNGNQVQIDGLVSVNYKGVTASRPQTATTRNGVLVTGDDNTLVIKGGLSMDYDIGWLNNGIGVYNHGNQFAVNLNGNGNHVLLSGESDFFRKDGDIINSFDSEASRVGLVYSEGSNNVLVLDENFRLTAEGSGDTFNSSSLFAVTGENSVLYNRGQLASDITGSVFSASDGARIVNEGSVTVSLQQGNIVDINAAIINGRNEESGVLLVSSWLVPTAAWGMTSFQGGITAGNQYAAMMGNNGLLNAGSISVRGAGAYGMTSVSGILQNSGTIEVDGMQLLPDEDGNDSGNKQLFTGMNNRELRGAGMHLRNSGTATNTGTITVTNSGTGMFASGTGVAWNQGTINLEADGSHNQQGWLYAMAATGNGVAINDTTGIININTDLGQAFYTAGNGKVFNYGTVNFNGSPINSGDPNWGAPSLESDYVLITTPVLTAEGESHIWRDESLPWLLVHDSASYGDATFDGELVLGSWLQNFGHLSVSTLKGSSLNNAGTTTAETLSVSTLQNSGNLSGTTLTVGNLNNTGTLTAGSLSVGTLRNSGEITGDMQVSSGVNLGSGTLNGNIYVTGNLRNDGTVYGTLRGGGSGNQ
ncbi:hypothetical protein, partial [Mangrovibacter plantisponsor]|uniref:hypothetical protein n=1 Tax=Mangrovibacter plantisponsor TaxID=451513 RepID=UPI00147577CD